LRFRAVLLLISSLLAAAEPPAPYSAVEVDPFVADRGVAFPVDYQSALREDIAREISLAFPAVMIFRPGETAPFGLAVLRISGTVTRFKPGNRQKRYLVGFGAGATVVQANVRFGDASTGQVLLIRKFQGTTWTGIAGGDSQSAGDSLARKLAKLCIDAHLVASN
jgi:Domain of unknown function (DUF4410)